MKSIEQIRRENLIVVKDRLCEGNQSELSRRLGYERPTMVNHWIAGRKNMNSESARAIEEKLGLPRNSMDADHSAELRPINGTHKISIGDASIKAKKTVLSDDRTIKERDTLGSNGRREIDQNVAPAVVGQRRIPIISYVQAGMMSEAADPFALGDGFDLVLTDLDVSEGAFGLRIKGDSMLDEFKEGEVVIIDPALEPLPGDFVVAKNTEDEATFKKYRPRGTNDRGEMVFELVPLNDDYPTLHSERDHLRVIGVMVEHRKYRKR
jgi:SOS-response transcriptional repressor LexA